MPNSLSSVVMEDEIKRIGASTAAEAVFDSDAVILASDGVDSLSDEQIAEEAAPERDEAEPSRSLAERLVRRTLQQKTPQQDNTAAACLRIDRSLASTSALRGTIAGWRTAQPPT